MKTHNDEHIDSKCYSHACVIAPQWGTFKVIELSVKSFVRLFLRIS